MFLLYFLLYLKYYSLHVISHYATKNNFISGEEKEDVDHETESGMCVYKKRERMGRRVTGMVLCGSRTSKIGKNDERTSTSLTLDFQH